MVIFGGWEGTNTHKSLPIVRCVLSLRLVSLSAVCVCVCVYESESVRLSFLSLGAARLTLRHAIKGCSAKLTSASQVNHGLRERYTRGQESHKGLQS
jgi:hypothetical protein